MDEKTDGKLKYQRNFFLACTVGMMFIATNMNEHTVALQIFAVANTQHTPTLFATVSFFNTHIKEKYKTIKTTYFSYIHCIFLYSANKII